MTTISNNGTVNHEAIQAAAAAWLAKQDASATWTTEDEGNLEEWLNQSPAHMVAWLRLKKAWNIAEDLQDLREPEHPIVAQNIAVKIRSSANRRLRWAAFVSVIAVLAIGITASMSLLSSPEEKFVTAVGARQEVTLSDGSRVTLNTRTRARAMVTAEQRTFWLDSGEAFFEIQRAPKHPFVIFAGRDRITVLGTKFSVRHENDSTKVTVLEGRVRLDHVDSFGQAEPKAATSLTRNDSAISQSDSVLVATKTEVQTEKDLSWREGRLEFENMPLSDIAAEFNRYNRRRLIVHEDAASLRLTVRFDAHNIDGFTRLIHSAFQVDVKENGEEIHLSMN